MKWKAAICCIVSIFGFCIAACSHANLTIRIVQGVDKPYPIAVVPFTTYQERLAKNLPRGFSTVIANDFAHSGQFSVMPRKQMPATPHRLDQFKWSAWHQRNAQLEFVVIGKVQPTSQQGYYNVTFQLLSMLGQRPLLGRVFSHIPAAKLRQLAHYISDQIYLTITGVRGYFSARLAYVTVQRASGPNPVYRLVVSDSDGENAQTLLKQSAPIASPTWSPNGKQLAYVSYLHNQMVIYAITLGTGKRQIIANFAGMNSAPHWSPNGKDMAMALSKGGSSRTNIYVMNLATRKLMQYTTFATNTSPAWSPNGKDLVFTSNRGGRPQIYLLNLKTRQVSRLTYDGVKNFSPIYTPDGQSIVMMHQQDPGGPIRIAIYNLAQNTMRVLTQGQLDKSPSVSPNGRMVIYANYDQRNGVLAESAINGRIHLQLPAMQGSVQSPAWSPFLN